MIPYLIVFFVTILFTYCAQKLLFKKKKSGRVFAALAILLPSLLAGIRAESVGTDVLVYAKPLYLMASHYSNFFDFWSYISGTGYSEVGIGYLIIAFISTNLQMLLFLTQLLTSYYIYKALYVYKDKLPMWIGMSVYLVMYYCIGLNAMRQCIAMAIALYALTQLTQKKYVKFSVYLIFAGLFHTSAFLILFFFGLWCVIGLQAKKWKILGISLICLVLVLNWNMFSTLVILTGVLPSHYIKYMQGGISLDMGPIMYQLPMLILETVFYKSTSKKVSEFSFFYLITTCGFCLIPIASVWTYSARVLYYFFMCRAFTVPMAFNSIQNRNNKKIVGFCVFLYLCLYWYLRFPHSNGSEAFPYVPFWH